MEDANTWVHNKRHADLTCPTARENRAREGTGAGRPQAGWMWCCATGPDQAATHARAPPLQLAPEADRMAMLEAVLNLMKDGQLTAVRPARESCRAGPSVWVQLTFRPRRPPTDVQGLFLGRLQGGACICQQRPQTSKGCLYSRGGRLAASPRDCYAAFFFFGFFVLGNTEG